MAMATMPADITVFSTLPPSGTGVIQHVKIEQKRNQGAGNRRMRQLTPDDAFETGWLDGALRIVGGLFHALGPTKKLAAGYSVAPIRQPILALVLQD